MRRDGTRQAQAFDANSSVGPPAGAISGVPQDVVDRVLAHLERIDPAYAAGVRTAIWAE